MLKFTAEELYLAAFFSLLALVGTLAGNFLWFGHKLLPYEIFVAGGVVYCLVFGLIFAIVLYSAKKLEK